MRYDTSRYEEFLQAKIANALAKLPHSVVDQITLAEVTTIRSPLKFFRHRVRFGVIHTSSSSPSSKNMLSYVMWDGGGPNVVVEAFPIAAEPIYRASSILLKYIEGGDAVIRDGLRAVHFLSTLHTQELLVTLLYERVETDFDSVVWQVAAHGLQTRLFECLPALKVIHIIGRAKGVCVTLGASHVTDVLHVADGRALTYVQLANGFSNPNAAVNEKALDWICRAVQEANHVDTISTYKGDLLELYCGNGNHTIAIAPFARRIVAVELNKALCLACQANLDANHVTNVLVVACDSARFASQILKAQYYETKTDRYDFRTVLVDPPRQGLDAVTLRLVAQYQAIVYISCSQESLARDLIVLQRTHRVCRFAVFDQFAYTPHLECGVYLQRMID